jgi:hypothetical protein
MASNYNGSTWSPTPVPLEGLSGFFLDPHIAMNSSGNAVVVWYESGQPNIYANQYVSGSWLGASVISDPSDGFGGHAIVAMDDNNTAIAVWEQEGLTSGIYSIWANRLSGGNWGTAEKIETDDTGDALRPRIAMDANGNGMAVWDQWDGTRTNIWANKFDTTDFFWAGALLIETDNAGNAQWPWIAADPTTNNFVTVWTQFDPLDNQNSTYANWYK